MPGEYCFNFYDVGIYALFLKRKLKWVLWPTGVGLVYFLFCVYIILPGFNKNTFNFFHIYGPFGGSLGQVVQTCFLHPALLLVILFQPYKIHYLIAAFRQRDVHSFFKSFIVIAGFFGIYSTLIVVQVQ